MIASGKLALGTAQFGMDYGVNNKKGMVPEEEVYSILAYAIDNGIDTLDTAAAYGGAESVIGRFLERSPYPFKILSKAAGDRRAIEDAMADSMERLHAKTLYGFMAHSFADIVKDPGLWDVFVRMRSSGKVSKIGCSFYYPSELEAAIRMKIDLDLIQVPYSIFDQRFVPYLRVMKEMGVEVHARSVFLQGLYFKDPATLSGALVAARDKLAAFNAFTARARIAKEALCLCFVASDPLVDKVVIGVDGLEHLKKNIEALSLREMVAGIRKDFMRFSETDEDIVVPSRWTATKRI